MNIEKEIFKRSEILFDKLESYGFTKKDNGYLLIKKILDNNFEVQIFIDKKSKIVGRIYDLSFKEEYINFRIESQNGEFVNKVREEYQNILIDIKNKCSKNKDFITNQANRISKLIKEKYGDSPNFPWEKSTGFGVFKNPSNQKWYSLIMNIDKSKIDTGIGEVEILNLKLNEEKILKLLDREGFYKAYHMNKQNWITILLDDTITDKEIMSYIEESHKFTEHIHEWVVPANYSYYDVIGHFKKDSKITWKQTANININDYVYLYIGAPISAILYKCKVLKNNIPSNYQDKNIKMHKVMEMELVKSFDKDKYTLEILKKYGVKAVRSARLITKELSLFINKEEKDK